MSFKVAVTVFHKQDRVFPLWNKVHLSLSGDRNDLINLQSQLDFVKAEVNSDMNRKSVRLKDTQIFIDFI